MAKAEKSSKDSRDLRRIITPEFRVSYPQVFKAVQFQGKGEPKYAITMLFKKTADLSVIKLAMKHAKIDAFGTNKADWPDDLESPVVDGDSPKYADRDGFKGHWAIKATSSEDTRPGVVGPDAEALEDPSDLYPGCYAHAQVFARVWEFGGKQGVHFILDHVQKTKDGKSFGGKKAIEEVFKPLEAEEAEEGEQEEETEEDFT